MNEQEAWDAHRRLLERHDRPAGLPPTLYVMAGRVVPLTWDADLGAWVGGGYTLTTAKTP